MMSNGAPRTDAKSGAGGASRDGGRDRVSRGATSVGKVSNGRTMTGGNTSGAATTLGAEVASSDGTMSHNGPMSASNGRIMTGGMTSGAATTIGAEAKRTSAPLGGEHLAARERAAGARDA